MGEGAQAPHAGQAVVACIQALQGGGALQAGQGRHGVVGDVQEDEGVGEGQASHAGELVVGQAQGSQAGQAPQCRQVPPQTVVGQAQVLDAR